MGSSMNGARLATQGATASKGLGLFSRLGSGIRAIKGVNWGGLITNASKTLNVVNQAIPLVRQVGPMVSNVKSMLRVASIFKDETDKRPIKQINGSNTTYKNSTYKNSSVSNSSIGNDSYTTSNNDDYSPTFFVNS